MLSLISKPQQSSEKYGKPVESIEKYGKPVESSEKYGKPFESVEKYGKSERTHKLGFLNNVDKGVASAREIFQSLTGTTPLKILKVSLKDEVDNQMKSSQNYLITPEENFNNVLSHPFLKDYVFVERLPIIFEKSKVDEGVEVISEEERELNEIQHFIEFTMGCYVSKLKNDTMGLYSLREKVEKMKVVKKPQKSLSTYKEREKVELEMWVNEEEEQTYDNKKVFINGNPVFLKFMKDNNNKEKNTEEKIEKAEKTEKRKELRIIGLNKQFEKTTVKLDDLDFGEILPDNETFSSFFSFKTVKAAWNELNIPGTEDIQFYYSSREKSKSQKLFLIIPLFYGYEMKIEFSYKFCKEVIFDQDGEDYINLYARLLIPPRIYLQNPNRAQYEAPPLRFNWPRVQNFFLLDNPLLNEIHKTYLMNNITLKLKFHRDQEFFLKDFQDKLRTMNIYKKLKKVNIKYRTYRPEQLLINDKIFGDLMLKNPRDSFNVKYNLLCLLTENKISIYDPEVLNIIKQIPKMEVEAEIIESVLEEMCKRLPRGFFSTSKDNSFSDIFDLLKKRKKRSMGLEPKASFFHILKTRKISLTPSGVSYSLKEPEMSNRVLRKYQEDLDLFLRVKFADDDMDDTKNMKFVIYRFFKPKVEKFYILDRKYNFLAFSASQLRGSACWMFAGIEKGRTVEDIVQDLGDFKDKVAAKKAARIGQSFSASFPIILNEMNPQIKSEDDLKAKNGIFSDGIGKISYDLIKQICIERKLTGISAIQVRFGGAKGVLSADPEMVHKNTIILRDSMVKFQAQYEDLEILDYNKYRGGYLNRQIILLLITLGVDQNIFKELQAEYLNDLNKCTLKDANIFQYFNAEYEGKFVDLPPITYLLRQLINAQFSLKDDPFIMGIERTLRLRGLILLKKKSNILVKSAARVLGVLDEYGVLDEDEVCVRIQIEYEGKKEKATWIEGDVMVTRNPCLHPGDIRRLKAVRNNKFEHFINCIVFPSKGDRPVTSMISGGDLDGDLYFVTWDKRLIPEKIAEPLSYESHKPPEVSDTKEIKLQHMLDFFIRYMNFDNLGKIANSHLALADQSPKLAFDDRCLRLSELHSDAVDFVKTGYCVEKIESQLLAKEWPDFMEKKDYLLIYESKTILGELYRDIKAIIKGKKETGEISSEKTELDMDYKLDLDLVYGHWEEFIEEAFEIFDNFQAEMQGLMNLFNIRNEFEVYSGNFSKFTKEERKGKVNVELLQKRVLDNIAMIKQKYIAMFKKDLIGKDNKELTKEEREILRTKASAIYIISYLNMKHTENEEYQMLFKKVFSYKKWRNFEENRERVVGLPWMVVSDWMIEIKQQKMKNDEKKKKENAGKEKEKGIENEEEKEGEAVETVRVGGQNSDGEEEFLDQEVGDKNKKKK